MYQTTAAAAAATPGGVGSAPVGMQSEQMQLELEASMVFVSTNRKHRRLNGLDVYKPRVSRCSVCRSCARLLQSLRGRVTAAEERLVAARSADFAAKQAPGRAAVDHRVAQLEQQLMLAQEACR